MNDDFSGCSTFYLFHGGEGGAYISSGREWVKSMDEGSKWIRHGGGGAYLRCPVFTTVHFSLRDEGSSEYIQVSERRESLRPNF